MKREVFSKSVLSCRYMKHEQNKCYNYTYNAYLHFSQEFINKFEQSPSFLSIP